MTLFCWPPRQLVEGITKVNVRDVVVTFWKIWIGLRVVYCGTMPWRVNIYYWNCRCFAKYEEWGGLGMILTCRGMTFLGIHEF